jgi:primosomal protein N' (replication factor Y)
MARLIVRGETVTLAQQFAEHLAELVKRELEQTQTGKEPENRLLGPAPAPIPRLRNMYRFHMQAQCADGGALRAAIRAATADLQPPDGVQWTVDIDPIDML